jgi:hypothetical protein
VVSLLALPAYPRSVALFTLFSLFLEHKIPCWRIMG